MPASSAREVSVDVMLTQVVLPPCCPAYPTPHPTRNTLQGGEKGGNARKEQMAAEHGGDASAGYSEMGQKGGQA